jgi:hypothetical protein
MTPPFGLSIYQPDKAYPGSTLLVPMPGTSAYLLAMPGRSVHCWPVPYPPALSGTRRVSHVAARHCYY